MATTTEKKEPVDIIPNDLEIQFTDDNSMRVPRNMGLLAASKWLKDKYDDQEKATVVARTFEGFPVEGAFALRKAIQEVLGWTKGVNGLFGDSPTWVNVQVGPNKTDQALWGNIVAAGLEKTKFTTGMNDWRFAASCETLNKHRTKVEEVFNRTAQILLEQSIYKGQAINLDLSWVEPVVTGRKRFNPETDTPTYLDLPDEAKFVLILNEETESEIYREAWTRIEQTDACRQLRVPMKTGLLLEGMYGTGKTLIATATALKCVRNGWTYIALKDVTHLTLALEIARRFQPCVVFAEDIDRVVGQDRSVEVDAILNTIDGVQSKNTEIITILTTNNLDDINPAMLRDGRTSPIHVGLPDIRSRERLIKVYGGDYLKTGTDLTDAIKITEGFNPAGIRFCVENAKMSALQRTKNVNLQQSIVGEDIRLVAISQVERQKRLTAAQPKKIEPVEALGRAIANTVLYDIKNTDWHDPDSRADRESTLVPPPAPFVPVLG